MYLGKFLEGRAMLRKKEAGPSSTGKSKGAVNRLKSAASGLTPAKREANSSLREVATLTLVGPIRSCYLQFA